MCYKNYFVFIDDRLGIQSKVAKFPTIFTEIIWTGLFQNWAEGGFPETIKNEEVIPNIFSNQVRLGVSYARWTRCEHSQVPKTHSSGSTGLKNWIISKIMQNRALQGPLLKWVSTAKNEQVTAFVLVKSGERIVRPWNCSLRMRMVM